MLPVALLFLEVVLCVVAIHLWQEQKTMIKDFEQEKKKLNESRAELAKLCLLNSIVPEKISYYPKILQLNLGGSCTCGLVACNLSSEERRVMDQVDSILGGRIKSFGDGRYVIPGIPTREEIKKYS
jgi:hypothetical protein